MAKVLSCAPGLGRSRLARVYNAASAPAPPPFTPADINGTTLKAWYDATAEVTDAGGGAVSAWGDRSSNSFDLSQGTGGLRPTTGAATLNGLNVITFAGDYMAAASAADWKFLHDGTEHCVVAVVKFGTTANPNTGYGLYGTNGTATASIGATLYFEDTGGTAEENIRHHVTRGVGGTNVARNFDANSADMVPANEWHMITVLGNPDDGTAALRSTIRVNRGLTIAANADTGAVSASNPTYALSVGSCANAVYPLTGAIAEIVMSTSWSDRLNIERYLALRWGVAPYRVDGNGPIGVE